MKPGDRVRIIVPDPVAERWRVGEVGTVVGDGADILGKYDVTVEFEGLDQPITTGFLSGLRAKRVFYFYKDEVELV